MSTTTIVTGGGTGIGRDVALTLARRGEHVTIAGRRLAPLDAVAAEAPDGAVRVVAADLGTVEGAESLAEAVRGRGVTGIVAAAGGQGDFMRLAPGARAAEAAWTDALQKNLMSAVLPIEAALPELVDGRGRVVLIGSTSGLDGLGGPYATAKAAMQGYGMDLARRLGGRQITANVVAPGFIADTEFFEAGNIAANTEMIDAVASGTMVGRVGRPADITACVMWLLSEDGGWTTGQVISPNGGTVLVH